MKMKRNIITINTDKCNGCGACIPNCPEGALQLIDGKARLISDLFCDGLGACIGKCPEGAMHIEEREAEPYDERKVMPNIVKAGYNTIKAHLLHLKEHGEMKFFGEAVDYLKENKIPVPELEAKHTEGCGCQGGKMRDMRKNIKSAPAPSAGQPVKMESQLQQWPVQLMLINPGASYFDNADLLISADCAPYAYANYHERFIKGKITITLCPKLDQTMDRYLEKLIIIFSEHQINSITVVHMEVPCCSGIVALVQKAIQLSGKNILLKEYTISINGEIV